MKAISIRRPWAGLIRDAVKTVELRTWRTEYLGPLLVVASHNLTAAERAAAERLGVDLRREPAGVSICVVDLVDVRPSRRADELTACTVPDVDREYAWVLERPRPIGEFDVKGRLGLFDVEVPRLAMAWRAMAVGT